MRRNIFALLVVLALAGFAYGRQTEWLAFSPEGGRFTIMMPGTPQPQVETKDSQFGPYTTHLFFISGDGELFMAAWVDYAPTFNFNVEAEIKANRDNFLKNAKAKLVSEKRITLDGHPGLEFTAQAENGALITSRIYIVGKRPYQLIAATDPKADQAKVTKFLSSFKLTPQK